MSERKVFVGVPASAPSHVREQFHAKWNEQRLQHLSAGERCHIIWAEIEGRVPRAGSAQ